MYRRVLGSNCLVRVLYYQVPGQRHRGARSGERKAVGLRDVRHYLRGGRTYGFYERVQCTGAVVDALLLLYECLRRSVRSQLHYCARQEEPCPGSRRNVFAWKRQGTSRQMGSEEPTSPNSISAGPHAFGETLREGDEPETETTSESQSATRLALHAGHLRSALTRFRRHKGVVQFERCAAVHRADGG